MHTLTGKLVTHLHWHTALQPPCQEMMGANQMHCSIKELTEDAVRSTGWTRYWATRRLYGGGCEA